MSSENFHTQARDDFNKARIREKFESILSILRPEKKELLSFYDVRSILKPKSESYRGMETVAVDKIVGSEGRYQDFNKAFLPRTDHLRGRWESVDRAHLGDVVLPPVKLYKIGEAYFVNDGNHRVSVAALKGVEFIDAEVTELSSEIPVKPGMTRQDLMRAIIAYEKERFIENTGFDAFMDMRDLDFSEPGRFQEILRHILGHKYYINQSSKQELSLEEGAFSWYGFIYHPIVVLIEREGLLARFPGRTQGDLYLWTVKHWDHLKKIRGGRVLFGTAAKDFSKKYGKGLFRRIKDAIGKHKNSG